MQSKLYTPKDGAFPFRGLNSYVPPSMLEPMYPPYMENIEVKDGFLRARPGYTQLGPNLPETILAFMEYESATNQKYTLCFTTFGQYYYDLVTDSWVDIAQQILLDGCDATTGWTMDGSWAVSLVTDDKKESTGSLRMVGTTTSATKIAYKAISSTDLSTQKSVQFWIKSTNYRAAGIVELVISSTTDGSKSGTYQTVQCPELLAGTWTKVNLAVALTSHTAVQSIGIYASGSLVEQTYQIDHIRTTKWVCTGLIPLSFVNATDTTATYAVVTNGDIVPQKWDTTGRFTDLSVDIASFVCCRVVSVYYNHLILADITTTSRESKLIAWSDTADFDDWTTGNSGASLFPDLDGPIIALLPLGERVVVYSQNSIGTITYVGLPSIIAFEVLVQNTRLVSPKAIINIGPYHVYMAVDNFYLFDGSRQVRKIGDAVITKNDYFVGFQGLLNRDFVHYVFAYEDRPNHRIYWCVPNDETNFVFLVLNYDLFDPSNNVWQLYRFAHNMRAAGTYTKTLTVTWENQGSGNWSSDSGPWMAISQYKGFSTHLFGSGTYAFNMDYTHNTDFGSTIVCEYKTPHLTLPGYVTYNSRWSEVEFQHDGDFTLSYRASDSVSSTTYGVVTKTDALAMQRSRVYFDFVCRGLELTFLCTGTSKFNLQWFRLWGQPGGDR